MHAELRNHGRRGGLNRNENSFPLDSELKHSSVSLNLNNGVAVAKRNWPLAVNSFAETIAPLDCIAALKQREREREGEGEADYR